MLDFCEGAREMRVRHALSMVLSRQHTNQWHKRHWIFHREHLVQVYGLWWVNPANGWCACIDKSHTIAVSPADPRGVRWCPVRVCSILGRLDVPHMPNAPVTTMVTMLLPVTKNTVPWGYFFFAYQICSTMAVSSWGCWDWLPAPRQACGTASRRVEQNA